MKPESKPKSRSNNSDNDFKKFLQEYISSSAKKPNSLVMKILDNLELKNINSDNGHVIIEHIRTILISALEKKLGFGARPIRGFIKEPEVIVRNNTYLRDELLLPILKEMKKIKDRQQLAIEIKH